MVPLCNPAFPKWFPKFPNALAIMFGVHQTFCCDSTPSRSLKPHSTAWLVNTTPNSWFWLLPSGNGFVLVVSWQGLGAQLPGCGLVGRGWGCGSPGLREIWGEVVSGGRTFSAHCMEVFCQCHGLLPLLPSGWFQYLVKVLSVVRNLNHCHTCCNTLRKPRGN